MRGLIAILLVLLGVVFFALELFNDNPGPKSQVDYLGKVVGGIIVLLIGAYMWVQRRRMSERNERPDEFSELD